MDPVRSQYERFPYPPVPALALPRRGQGRGLSFERGLTLAGRAGRHRDDRGIRILVAGAGTLEALVVADLHPRAREVVAVDLSAGSIARLDRRMAWARFRDALSLRRWRGGALPPVHTVTADLWQWEDGRFDYILASNLLQHVEDPAGMLVRLAGWLNPDGLLRVVTYPKASRHWMRETGAWLRWHGLAPQDPALAQHARAVVGQLPAVHPVRATFAAHREVATATGIVDAFLHARENPLSPLEWGAAAARAGLALVAEDQSEHCRSQFVDELMPSLRTLATWTKLQLLDDLLELTASPVLWFAPVAQPEAPPMLVADAVTDFESTVGAPDVPRLTPMLLPQRLAHAGTQCLALRLPSRTWWQLGAQLRRAERLLETIGVPLDPLIAALREQVGPHWSPPPRPRILPGHSLTEYDLDTLRAAPPPWDEAAWQQLAALVPDNCALWCDGARVPGAGLVAQAAWLQLHDGSTRPWINCELRAG